MVANNVRDHRDSAVVVRDHRHHETRPVVRDHRHYEVVPSRMPPVQVDDSRVDRARREADQDNSILNDQVAKIFSDPTLSFEDRLEFFLLALMEHMDRKLDKKAKEVTDLQTQQDKSGGNSKTVTGADGQAKSVDVETQELSRLVTKREQLFAMIESIVDKLAKSTDKVNQKMSQG